MIGTWKLRWLWFMTTGLALAVVVGIIALVVQHTAAHQLAHYVHVRDLHIVRHVAHKLDVADHREGWRRLQQRAEDIANQLGVSLVIHPLGSSATLKVGTLSGQGGGPGRVIVPLRRGSRILGWVTLVNPPSFEPELSPVLRAIERALMVAAGSGFLLALGVSGWFGRIASKPLETLSSATRRVAEGRRDIHVPVTGVAEAQILAKNFNVMTEALAASEHREHQFVAYMAHELRTPLSVLGGYLEALDEGVLVPGYSPDTVLRDQVRHLVRLVDDLQTLALADARELTLRWESIEFASWLGVFLQPFRDEAQRRGLTFHDDLPSTLPRVVCDADRIGQALHNILQNAFKYTPSGGNVTVSAQADLEAVIVQVHDTGIGVRPEELPYLFDRLYRTDPARSRDTGGAGLGLAVTKQLITLHGGQVGVNAGPGPGTTFWLKIPQHPRQSL